jgi:hypothetical protein
LHIQDHLVRHAIGVQHLGRFLLLGCRWLSWKRLLQKHAQVAQRKLPCSWYALQWLYQAQHYNALGLQQLGRFLLLGCRWLIWKRLL